ncbi:hypothetical protein E4U58_002499 [Claviceps cyperi]|nr:hypothetical protein E4U58_002499 [Claviceps cyperi]
MNTSGSRFRDHAGSMVLARDSAITQGAWFVRDCGYFPKTLTNPYRRLMNTSGSRFRDHAGSMDLCTAALQFASETLKPGGHFVCKFYQGAEDKKLEDQLKKIFDYVCREKPEASRAESNEAYFVALRRKHGVQLKLEEE